MSNTKTSRRDPNSTVTVGMSISGRISKKMEDFLVITFKNGKANCSGTLHVSEFPSLSREERDAMFGVAEVGMPAPGLEVILVSPPDEKRRYTKVRLSALKPLKDKLPPKPDQGKRERQPAKPHAKANPRPAGDAKVDGGNDGGSSGGKSDGNGGGATTEGGKPKSHHQGNGKRNKHRNSKGTSGGDKGTKKAKGAKPAARPAPAAAVDHLEAAGKLIASVRQAGGSVSRENLARAMALRNAAADVGFMARIAAMEQGVARVAECDGEIRSIHRAHDAKALDAAIKVHAARAQGVKLDAEAAAIKQDSARYASLCRKAKANESDTALQSEKEKAKSALDARRAKLATDREANKKARDDADFELVMVISAGAGSDDYERLVGAAESLANWSAEKAAKTAWLGKMVARSNRHLEAKPDATAEAAAEAKKD